ncbi:PQQ-binding-like beta-propeller repeat protein [Natronococcus sp.]|uniref:PQQ-binding-like beta-propeller repeat protein n=1 Tax=Natronococcus sp. TaxID=35747 RepID=UPI003A4D7BC0
MGSDPIVLRQTAGSHIEPLPLRTFNIVAANEGVWIVVDFSVRPSAPRSPRRWPGEGFDGANTGFNSEAELLEAPPNTTPITREGSGIETSLGGGVAVADDRCYFGSGGDVVRFATTGQRRWAYEADTAAGVRSIPALSRDVVYVSSDNGTYALDREDGTTVWSHDRETTGTTQPTVGHGRVYLPRETRSRTVCLDLESGEPLWTLETDFYSDQPVAVADGVYFGTPNEGLFAVEPDGTVRWHDPELRTDGRMAAVGESLYAVAFGGPFGSGDLHALSPADGSD